MTSPSVEPRVCSRLKDQGRRGDKLQTPHPRPRRPQLHRPVVFGRRAALSRCLAAAGDVHRRPALSDYFACVQDPVWQDRQIMS